jgi:putative transferase (TIGR04331 family)
MKETQHQIGLNAGPLRSPFLATIAIEEFWDTSKPIVFLGEWCRRFSRRDRWQPLNAVVLPSPFDDIEKLTDAVVYSGRVYERMLKELTVVLNTIHNKKHSDRYWRIVIGPWLFHYIDVCYDRYASLKNALSEYPDFETIGLADQCFVVAKDTLSYIDLICDDKYNLQIYTRMLNELGKSFNVKHLDLSDKSERILSQRVFSKNNLLHTLFRLGARRNFKIVELDSYFTIFVKCILFIKTAGRFQPFIKKIDGAESAAVDESLRSKITIGELYDNEFESILSHMLPHDIPQCFLETYASTERVMQKKYPSCPDVIFSTVSYYFDECFKQWAAASSEQRTLLIGIQHGGNYGSEAFMPTLEHEIAITDRYYSWGWHSCELPLKISPMPATKLVGRKTIGASNQKDGILFACTTLPRYLYRIQIFNNAIFPEYLNWQYRFVRSLDPFIRDRVSVRLFHDYGWDLRDRWQDHFPDVKIENMEIPFLKSMASCRIFVCDHLSTVHAEALSADKPTLLFWNPASIKLKDEVIPYYDELRASGILHDSPESAAEMLIRIYEDVEGWWHASERTSALKRFNDRFARTSTHAIKEWARELRTYGKNSFQMKNPDQDIS